MKKIVNLFIGISIIITWSCNSSNQTQTIDQNDTIADTIAQANEEVFYQVPSPDEFISLLKESKAPFKANIVSPISDYVLPLKQKMNLGVYAADMAYLATYGKFQETVRYFGKIKSMADNLGLSNAIEKSAMERIEKNITNLDSLTTITNNSFYNIMEQLKQNSDESTVASIYIGGWIESMYIALQLVNKFEQNNPIIQRIAAQKLALNNLILMLKSQKNINNELLSWLNSIQSLYEIFNSIETKTEEVNTSTANNKVIIGSKTTYLINKETYEKIKNIIENYRNEIIKQ
ncbi:MAG: hypothetical protein N2449_07720 [Bacteroidales bacterium]|nr:hypothetical protein [Bacteroidales bacterium]